MSVSSPSSLGSLTLKEALGVEGGEGAETGLLAPTLLAQRLGSLGNVRPERHWAQLTSILAAHAAVARQENRAGAGPEIAAHWILGQLVELQIEGAEGGVVVVSRPILAAHSAHFRAQVARTPGAKRFIFVEGSLPLWALRKAVEWTEKGRVVVEMDELFGLLTVAEVMGMEGLGEALGETLVGLSERAPGETTMWALWLGLRFRLGGLSWSRLLKAAGGSVGSGSLGREGERLLVALPRAAFCQVLERAPIASEAALNPVLAWLLAAKQSPADAELLLRRHARFKPDIPAAVLTNIQKSALNHAGVRLWWLRSEQKAANDPPLTTTPAAPIPYPRPSTAILPVNNAPINPIISSSSIP